MIPIEDYAAQTVAIADQTAELERQLARYHEYARRFAAVRAAIEQAHAQGSSTGEQLDLLHKLDVQMNRIEEELVSAIGRLRAVVQASE